MHNFIYKLNIIFILIFNVAYAADSESNGVGIDLTLGFFKGKTQDSPYGIHAKTNQTNVFPNGYLLTVLPDTNLGGKFGVWYRFNQSPFGVALEWQNSNTKSEDVTNGFISLTQITPSGAFEFADSVIAKTYYTNNILNLLFTAEYKPTQNITVNSKVGVSYVYIKDQQNNQFNGGQIPDNTDLNIDERSRYIGAGGVFAFNIDYGLYKGFGVFSNFAYLPSVGKMKGFYDFAFYGFPIFPQPVNVKFNDKSVLVRMLQSEIGASYGFKSNSYKGKILLGFNHVNASSSARNNHRFLDFTQDSLFISSITDSGFYGPFVRVLIYEFV